MYIVRWLGHNGNSLYGFMGLQSKMLEWVSGVDGWMDTPQTVTTTRAPAVLISEDKGFFDLFSGGFEKKRCRRGAS